MKQCRSTGAQSCPLEISRDKIHLSSNKYVEDTRAACVPPFAVLPVSIFVAFDVYRQSFISSSRDKASPKETSAIGFVTEGRGKPKTYSHLSLPPNVYVLLYLLLSYTLFISFLCLSPVSLLVSVCLFSLSPPPPPRLQTTFSELTQSWTAQLCRKKTEPQAFIASPMSLDSVQQMSLCLR